MWEKSVNRERNIEAVIIIEVGLKGQIIMYICTSVATRYDCHCLIIN